MANEVYALLVGINDYPANVGRLNGCLNDVDHFHDYLTGRFQRDRLHVEVLKNSQATRAAIISQFRSHLAKATTDDVVVFQYSGHGARWKSAKAFKSFYPEGMDEGLVCIDSREPGGYDLADKELAVLIAELAKNAPHIAVILDCCHSGSATRCADDFSQLRARQTHERADERPLESYLDGYYSQLLKRGERLEIPPGQHIALTACDRTQKALESHEQTGVFTSTILEVLKKAKSELAYAELFVRCRAMVRRRAFNQVPQFETFQGFNAYSGFLGGSASNRGKRYSVYFDAGEWNVDCGALHGLPSEPHKSTQLALYRETSPTRLAGHASTKQVGAQQSLVLLNYINPDESVRFEAEITSLPVPPMLVSLEGDEKVIESLLGSMEKTNDKSFGFALSKEAIDADYVLRAESSGLSLLWRETGKLIQGTNGTSISAANYMFDVLRRVSDWKRAIKLQNLSTKMDTSDVRFHFSEETKDGPHLYDTNSITLDFHQHGGVWTQVEGKFLANNRSAQPLYFALIHLSDNFGIQVIYEDRVAPVEELFTLTPGGESIVRFFLEQSDGDEVNYTFKLIVSTEKVDGFLLAQEPMKIGNVFDASRTGSTTRGFGVGRKKLVHQNEWFTKDLHFKLVRQLDRVSTKDAQLANGKIKVKGHPSLKADISLGGAKAGSRSAGSGPDFYRALERQGFDLLNFAGTRGDVLNVLELTDIKNPESLKDNPLEIELDIDLAEGEFILPFAFDGEHILLTGDPSKNSDGKTRVLVSSIPEIPDNRRSLGRALKMYFFKTFLSQENVNQLCWIEYNPDGSFERRRSQVAEKVAAAKNVVVLIHGIIGNTDSIVKGLQLAKEVDGKSLNQKFDLVLTYDYENLSTPISETAVKLKEQLAAVGLHESDNKKLTLIVHSMGGLVSRWFIEREGGNKVVDHLVMFGTPNDGSPFGKVESARQLSSIVTTLAINTFPAFAPFGGALLYLLNGSRKLTPSLEQMNPTSDFITKLNSSPDPGIPYTIVAGDIRDYDESTDPLMTKLIAKVGQGVVFDVLFRNAGHDIAVGIDSIRSIPDNRTPPPQKHSVICHHLNYFVAEDGLKAMIGVRWGEVNR